MSSGADEGKKESEEEGKGGEIAVGTGEGGREMEGRGGEIAVGTGEGGREMEGRGGEKAVGTGEGGREMEGRGEEIAVGAGEGGRESASEPLNEGGEVLKEEKFANEGVEVSTKPMIVGAKVGVGRRVVRTVGLGDRKSVV